MKCNNTHPTATSMLLLAGLLFLITPLKSFPQDALISTGTELNRLFDITKLPVYMNESEVGQISSYDRKGGNNDGFEGTYSYLYKTKDSSLVVFEATGKGVIERIWTPTPTEDTLDFYFDGSKTPSYSIKYRDHFTGNVYPFVSPVVGHKVGGFYSYLPMPFENGCKIVFRGKKILFHQFQYRKLSDRYTVQTFNPNFSEKDKKQLQNVVMLWNKQAVSVPDFYKDATRTESTNKTLLPGQSLVLANIKSGGRIVGIELSPAHFFENLDNLIDLKVTWDDEKSPAIYAPVADFFGFAFGSKSMQSLLMGVDSTDRAYCFMPMPFDKAAKVELIYRNGGGLKKPVKIKAKISYQAIKRNPDAEGKLYANWKREAPALGQPYVFLEGEGKGHYVGTILQSQGKSYTEFTEFFEGDDSTVIDGVNSIHGTGSEDYFNGGWYAQAGGWVERLGTSLHGCLDYSLPFSRTGGYRFYITDKLPFRKAIYHSIEHGPERNNRAVEYTSLAFYYAGNPIQKTAIPTNATSKVFIPDTLTFYARLMDHLTYEGKMSLKDGNAVLDVKQEGVTNVNVAELTSGAYQLYLNIVADKDDDSEVKVLSGGEENIAWGKLAAGKRISNFYYIGDVKIKNPNEPLKFLFKANSDKVTLHRVMLVKKKL